MAKNEALPAMRPPMIHVAPGYLRGTLTPPPSKSCAHRALICAALSRASLAGGESSVTGLEEPSDDILATQACLYALLDGDEIGRASCRERV